jgi:dTDP-4-dehydrorhamnose 3,5-epimerase-like enzyme|tara:strand:- start:10768 stop:11190 length:423 start_codon:yes stop_codon:yes gene_type:complete
VNNNITVEDVRFFNLKTIVDIDGNLVPIESGIDTTFEIKRVFYVYGVKDQNNRGKHSHYTTEQILICLNGKLEVLCDDGNNKKKYLLESPQQALYIPSMIWDEQIYLSDDTVMLALCNTTYNTDDYIENYDEFLKIKNNT